MTKHQLLGLIDVCLAGRASEEIVYGVDSVTTGASDDINKATSIALAMVSCYGFSESVGIISQQSLSDNAAKNVRFGHDLDNKIEFEVTKLVNDRYRAVKTLIKRLRKDLDIIARGLIDYESLSGAQIVALLDGKPILSGNISSSPSRKLREFVNRPAARTA
jgi:ATP-dependent Zn protease